jgi:hypothetical protein
LEDVLEDVLAGVLADVLEDPVRPIVFSLVFAVGSVASISAAFAQNYPWCANFADGAGVNCGFSTYEQCMATSQGSGGSCTRNNLYVAPGAAAPAPQAAHKHRSHGNN